MTTACPSDLAPPPQRHAGFWSTCLFATDHKTIGVLYTLTALLFLLAGLVLMMVMRHQVAWPGQPIPLLGRVAGDAKAPGGVMRPDFYNQLVTMHGTLMTFLGVVPLAVGGFGNFLVPLQIGASEMAFPTLNRTSYWMYAAGGVTMLASFFAAGGAPQSGWTSYPPLADIAPGGQTFWLAGMLCLITSGLLGAMNVIVTIVQVRAPGLTFGRLPVFVWTQLTTAFIVLLAFPPLAAAGVLQMLDRVAGASFFLPDGLVVNGQVMPVSGGGSPILWQHLFWFLPHPELHVLVLPAIGIVAEVIANNTRRPLWAYRTMVGSVVSLGLVALAIWTVHVCLTAAGAAIPAFLRASALIMFIPSIVVVTILFVTLWGGSIRFTTPMLFALAFLPMFGLGCLTGLPLALARSDTYLRDTYYAVAQFHLIVAGGMFAMFAGFYYWFPKATGRRMDGLLGAIHFWGSFACINLVFLPMILQGLGGMHRRLYDGGAQYATNAPLLKYHVVVTIATVALGLFQLPFIANFFASVVRGRRVDANPWEATTLEWATASPPAHRNFAAAPAAYRGPYEYSVPGEPRDFTPQFQPERT